MAISGGDGSIILTTKVDTGGLQDGLDNVKNKVGGVGKQSQKTSKTTKSAFNDIEGKVAAVGVAIAAALIATLVKATKEIINFSKEASRVAMEAQASVLRLADIYGEASNAVGDFINQNATALGMSKAAAASFASVYGNLFSVWADQATNAELTNRYLNMTAVVASKTGRTVEDVQERVRSGLLGNTEAIEDLGIFVNIKTIEITDAFQRMANGKSWEQLDAYTQQQIRTMAILEQATQKYGQEVASTAVLSKSRLSSAWQDFQATWGKAINVILIPILETVTKIIQVATIGLQGLFGYSGNILEDVDLTANSIGREVEKQKEFTDEMQKTAKAQKGILAGFDEINSIGAQDSSSEEGSSGINVDLGLSNAGNQSNFVSGLESFRQRCEKILEPLKESFVGFGEGVGGAFDDLYNKVLVPFAQWLETEFSPSFIQNITKEVDTLGNEIKELVDNLSSLENGSFQDALKDIIKFATDYVLVVIDSANDILGMFNTTFTSIKAIFGFIGGFIGDVLLLGIKSLTTTITSLVAIVLNAISLVAELLSFIANFIATVFYLISGNTDKASLHFKKMLTNIANFWIALLNVLIAVVNYVWALFGGMVAVVVNTIGRLAETIGELVGKDWNLTFNMAKFPTIPYVNMLPIPKLAQGTVVPPNSEFLAVLGDNTREHEIVSPVSTIKQAVAEVLAQTNIGGGFNGRIEVPVIVDGREIARAVRDAESDMGSQTVFGGFANVY